MKKIIINTGFAICCLAFLSASYAYTINNKSSFYLFAKDSAGCPNVAPGETERTSTAWCGYLACATKNYDNNQGCMEQNSDKTGLTQGGYATWFSLSGPTSTCAVPDGNTYQCSWDAKTGDVNFQYLPVTQKYSFGNQIGQPVQLPKNIATYSTGPSLRGVNVSGLEYDGTFLDAMFQHPDIPDVKYFAKQGMNTVRLPIRWEFVLHSGDNLVESADPASKTVNTMYINGLKDVLQKYLEGGLTVIIDLHNYMRFCPTGAAVGQANEPTDPVKNNCQVVNADQLAYIWSVLAKELKPLAQKYPKKLIFELMNEPYSQDGVSGQELSSEALMKAEAAAIISIRAESLNNLILLGGNYWDPLHGWTVYAPSPSDKPNGEVFTAQNLQANGITDLSNIGFDMHQYLDSNYSGLHDTCNQYTSYDDFKQKLDLENNNGQDLFGDWLKTNHMKVFLGEFGAADNATCQQDLNYLLQFVNDHAYDLSKPENGGFIGWTAWRANRHGGDVGFAPFNYLQAADYTVYGGKGTKEASDPGTGIVLGLGNGLMNSVFSNYLNKPE